MGWSLATALNEPEEIDATIIYYGRLVTEEERLAALASPVLGIFGALDRGIPLETVREFEAALEKLGKNASIHIYEGANHAFNNDTNEARYDKEAADLAWSRTVGFLKRYLTE